MKNLRQELIDFNRWNVREFNLPEDVLQECDIQVDLYLKSIDSAQSEALSVGNNEGIESLIPVPCGIVANCCISSTQNQTINYQ